VWCICIYTYIIYRGPFSGGTEREAIKEMCPKDLKTVRETVLKCGGCMCVLERGRENISKEMRDD
jgi:hypothetical protein